MRFKLCLNINNKYGKLLPLNYQYELSSLIYRVLYSVDKQYTHWLHENGFQLENKRFKLFNFSRLQFPKNGFEIDTQKECLLIKNNRVNWYLSFLPEKSTLNFIQGAFAQQNFTVGDTKNKVEFFITKIDALPFPEVTENTIFRTLSPVCIAERNEKGKSDYLSPDDPKAASFLQSALINRYEAFYQKEFSGNRDFDFRLVNTPKPVLIKIKADTPQQTFIKGYLFNFQLHADPELLKIMYECGLGSKNSTGFGFIDVKN